MTIYEGLTLGFIALGMVFIVLGFTVKRTKDRIKSDDEAMEDETFRKQINLVNEKVLELDDYHNFVKDEIENKHKELLFLYQMISEKEKSIREIQLEIQQFREMEGLHKQKPLYTIEAASEMPEKEEGKERNNSRIIRLREQGYNATEIAKILNIGVGEVNLVLNLFN